MKRPSERFSDGLYYSQKFLPKSLEQYFFYTAVIGFFHKFIHPVFAEDVFRHFDDDESAGMLLSSA